MEAETTTHVHGFLDAAMGKPESNNNAPSLQRSLQHSAESPAAAAAAAASSFATGAAADCFSCSICLDSAADPVVTLCGHLYCWPCIYRWMLHRLEAPPWCPVCRSPLSEASLVPLYGRGVSRKAVLPRGLEIPSRRPLVQLPPPRQRQIHRYGAGDNGGLRLHYGHMSEPVFYSTAGGVIGGIAALVLPSLFRNDRTDQADYDAPYGVTVRGGGRRTRATRSERLAERSLHQLWLFFFLCAILCLLLF